MSGERLSDAERRQLGDACRDLDLDRIRIRRAPGDTWRALVLFLSGGRAVALGRNVFVPHDRGDDIPLLAHELTHCRQHQRWGALRYYRRGAAEQLRHLLSRIGAVPDPYDWRSAPPMPFEEYGMEQQGQIVEDACRGDARARAIVAANSSTSSSVVSQDAIQRTSDRSSFHT